MPSSAASRSCSARIASTRRSPLFAVEPGQLLANPLLGRTGPFHRMAERGGGVDGREHLAARRLDVTLEPLDVPLDLGVLELLGLQCLGRVVTRGRTRSAAASRRASSSSAGRLTTRLELLDL